MTNEPTSNTLPLVPTETPSPAAQGPRIKIVDALRGVAALAVCWYHFTGVPDFLPTGIVRSSGRYGYLGVAIFFVISGFVIPYTLHRSSYTVRNYARFVAKRIVRLDPPYFVSIAMVL